MTSEELNQQEQSAQIQPEAGVDPLEEYNPQSEREVKWWTHPYLGVPTHAMLSADEAFTWTAVISDSRSVIIINLVHADFPGSIGQIQLLTPKVEERLICLRAGDKKQRIPKELMHSLFRNQIRPILAERNPDYFRKS